jgi:putative ABC transport system substrate-binding protein
MSKYPKWAGLFAIIVALTLCGARADAQPGKIFRIGFLDSSTPSGSAVVVEVFRQELRKIGWIEGKNIVIEFRFAQLKNTWLSELAAELVGLKVDLIVAAGAPEAIAAKKATTSIPILMVSVSDPVAAGLVASLARPGGNITGFSNLSYELNRRRLALLKDTIPNLMRVGLLRQPGASLQLNNLRAAAGALKLSLEEIPRFDPEALEGAFLTAKQKHVGAIITTTTRTFFAARKSVVDLAVSYRLPAIYFQSEFVDEGGLMSYGEDSTDILRNAAQYVDKILKGAKPADLSVQQTTKFEFVVNLKAAKQIGLAIPALVLRRANQVIR